MRLRCVLPVLALAFVLAQAAHGAGDSQSERATLKGLEGIFVDVVEFTEQHRGLGFSKALIAADVELKLSMRGIKVLSSEEARHAPGAPFLDVSITALHETPEVLDAYAVTLNLYQKVKLQRPPSISALASTWHTGFVGRGNAADVRSEVKHSVDKFIEAWLSVNPKK